MRVVLLALIALVSFNSPAQAGSIFDPEEIQRTIVAFYKLYRPELKADTQDPLTDIDKVELAQAIAEHISLLKPTQFNDVLGHLAAEYRQSPENRDAIGVLMLQCQDQVAAQLMADKSSSAVVTVIHDVFTVWAIYSSIGFAKGWVSKGAGLQTLKPFQRALQWVMKNRNDALLITVDGVTVGVTHAIINYLTVKKLSPRDLLAHAQQDVLYEIASMAAARLAELRALPPEQLKNDVAAVSKRLKEIEKEFFSFRSQLAQLKSAAPQLTERARPIATDLLAIEGLLVKLRMSLGEAADLTDSAPPTIP